MRVLFICTGNSFRSPAAEALTRKFQPHLEVESAGTHPTDHIANDAKRLLARETAKRYVKPNPNKITQRAINEADLIIVFEKMHKNHLLENFQLSPQKIINWNIEDPIKPTINPEDSFAQIKEKIKELSPERAL
jgi:protein-tyrosine-phosphatase